MKYDIKKFKTFKYIIRYPTGYVEGNKYPVILFLHGAGSRGDDIDVLRNNPFFQITDEYTDFPFITVAPQCSEDTWFDQFGDLKELVLNMPDCIDCDRVYAMGASMGGYAVWQLAMSLPDVLSAVVPICGGGMYWNARRLVNTNIWAFHGADDGVVLARETMEMVKRVNAAGGNAICTIYDNTEHDSWSRTYSNPDVFKWLLRSKKGGSKTTENKYDNSELYG